MNKERAITYSLLAHIRNTGSLAKGPIDIFIPLIKRALSKMNNEGVYKGKSIIEIKNRTDILYNIDFPIPVLKKILNQICKEINTDEITHLKIYGDGAFSINQYTFTDYEEIITNQEKEINEIEELFQKFCETSELEIENSSSIFKFIEKNKFALSKYIANSQSVNGEDYTSEAQFIKFFRRVPTIYERIKNIYIGSIIAGYIEYNPEGVQNKIELLLDTNFIVGLLDLNTPESTHTCQTLIKIAKQQGYSVTILKDTIEETKNLLEAKAFYFDKSFLQRKVNPEDVYNACERKGFSKIDLERVADNLEDSIGKFGISIIYHTDKLKGEAKYTEEYKRLEQIRNTKKSALHDAVAILYIKKKRGKRTKIFDKVNSWFVNNSASVESDNIYLKNGYQPETIKADDLLNILWLSNPQINKEIDSEDLAEIGLTSIISLTLNKNLPKSQILRELDDNIHKYAKEEINDTDIVRVATRITNNQLKNIEELNLLAEKDKETFIKRLEEEANKQKLFEENRNRKLEQAFKEISLSTEKLEKAKSIYESKTSNFDTIIKENKEKNKEVSLLETKLLEEQNHSRELKRNQWIKNQIWKWRRITWIEFFAFLILFTIGVIYLLSIANWNLSTAIAYFTQLKTNVIIAGVLSILVFLFSGITLKTLVGKYRNHSNIENYKKGLKIPVEYKKIKKAQ